MAFYDSTLRGSFTPQALTPQQMGVVSAGDIFNNIIKGNQAGFSHDTLAAALLNQQLQNKIDQAKANLAPQMTAAELAKTQANTGYLNSEAAAQQITNQYLPDQLRLANEKAQKLADNPYAYSQLTGTARDYLSLQLLGQRYGEDSPIYQSAKNAMDEKQQAQQGLIAYRQGLTQNNDRRFATPTGKLSVEENDVDLGFLPGTGRTVPITPEQQQNLKNRYELKRQKDSSDTDTRKRALFATNAQITLQGIDPYALTQFSGLKGAAKLAEEEVKAQLGKPSDDFLAYQRAKTNATLLAKQVRQMYGDSITPGVQEKLALLTNPSTLRNSPQVALSIFKTFSDILKREAGTFHSALKSTRPYEGPASPDLSKPVSSYVSVNGSSPYAKSNSPDELVTVFDRTNNRTMKMTRKQAEELAKRRDKII